MYIPTAAMRDACLVSSAMCADASNPVIVYCGHQKPEAEHVAEHEAEVGRPGPKPELLTVSEKT